MKGIADILEQLEKLMYKILLWVILIPKTIIQITLHPGWAAGYIKQEMDEGKSRFDAYMSPVILFLICALIPSVLINFLPRYGVEINSPAIAEPSPNRFLEFDAKGKFISTSTSGHHEFIWSVQKKAVDENGEVSYPIIKSTRHTSNQNDSNEYVYFNPIDANTLQDFYFEEFTDAGSFWIILDVSKFDANGRVIESYRDDQTFIYVPEDFNESLYVSTNSNNAPEKPGEKKFLTEQVSDQLKKESTYLLALGLLIPPLIFALAIRLFTGKTVSEELLKDIFYAQCYYFAPISLAIWATYYAIHFTTSDVFFYNSMGILIVLLPLLLSVIWFIAVETNAIASERHMGGWKAFLVVLLCLAIILGGGTFMSFATNDLQLQDDARKIAIWFYPLAAFGLMAAFGMTWFRMLKAENKKLTRGNWVMIIGILAVIVSCILSIVFIGKNAPVAAPVDVATQNIESTEPPSSEIQEASPATEPPTQALPTDTPSPEAQPFYTEEFDTNNDNWTYFVVDGNTNRIADEDNPGLSVFTGNGALTFDLNDNNLWTYSTYDPFEYEDVRIDMHVANRGVNTNDVSLICRYTDTGWYEFNIGNDGLYTILFVKVDSSDNVSYKTIFEGGSTAIKSGKGTNEYTAICSGRTLSLYINGKETRVITETNYNLTSGKIGVSVSSFDVLPVAIDVDWVMISEP